MATDPSQLVNDRMLPHAHLISTFRYAVTPNVQIHDVAKWLTSAPKIARDTASFMWTYLDAPQDGTVILTWQPFRARSVEFSSDGYVWSGPEVFYQNDLQNGTILEIYWARAGYRPGDQVAKHARRRFRLVPKAQQAPNAPSIDPSLFIVHYGAADPNDQIPANLLRIDASTQQNMSNRAMLLRAGQIMRKEFMLNDRAHWPQIPLPRLDGGSGGGGGSASGVAVGPGGQRMHAPQGNQPRIPQAQAYPSHPMTQHQQGGGPAPGPKRQRVGGPQQQQMMGGGGAPQFEVMDDEEDTSRGDMFDHMTPRDLSLARYRRNHEWMEEVLGSAYRIGQINPPDLGLGLQGQLASLTDGIYEAPGADAHEKAPKKPVVGQLDPVLAEEFRKRVAERIEAANAEMAEMETRHSKLLGEYKNNLDLLKDEKDLRNTTRGTGSELWRLEGRLEEDGDQSSSTSHKTTVRNMEEVVSSIEAKLGRQLEATGPVQLVQAGGYQEPVPEPELPPTPIIAPPVPAVGGGGGGGVAPGGPGNLSRQPSNQSSLASGLLGGSDTVMSGTAGGMLDQIHGGASAASTPGGPQGFPTPQPHTSAATPANQPAAPQGQSAPTPTPIQQQQQQPRPGSTAPDQGTGSGDWVVVPPGGVSPPAQAPTASSTEAPKSAPTAPGSAAATPGYSSDHAGFNTNDLNTAGDALAGYGESAGGDGLDMDLDMDDSAFGEAFHGVGAGAGDGGSTPADGGL